jgi:hypothetical protein
MLAQSAEASDGWFEEWGLAVLITVVVAIVITIVLQLVRRFRNRGSPATQNQPEMIGTLTTALSTTGIAVVWSVTILIALDKIGVPLSAVRERRDRRHRASSGPSPSSGLAVGLSSCSRTSSASVTSSSVDHREPGRRQGGAMTLRVTSLRLRRHAAHRAERQHPAVTTSPRLGARYRRRPRRVRGGRGQVRGVSRPCSRSSEPTRRWPIGSARARACSVSSVWPTTP